MSAPLYVTYYVLAADIAIIAAVLAGLRAALARAGWEHRRRKAALRQATALLLAWFAIALALSYEEAFRGAANRQPTIEFGVLVPIVIGLALLWRSSTVRRVLDAVPQSWLVGVQFYRALGLIFLLLLGEGRLPPQFALPAGYGDVAVGLTAPVVAWAYARGVYGRETIVRAWNLFGLLDLLVAVGTGFMTSPSPFQSLSVDAPNELISAFPLVMVPVFAVPLSVLLHVASLMKLGRSAAHTAHDRATAT